MKKILYLFLLAFIALPMVANAATFNFSPSTGSFAPGEIFEVVVFVNPSAGEEITTAKLSAVFSASVLEIVSFSQASGWIPLTQPGYDLIDNSAGKLEKTAGFPLRVTESKIFGTLTLKAKSAGSATLSVAGDSLMLDVTNANKYVASTGASFTIVAPTTTPPATPTTPTGVSGTVVSPTPTADSSAAGEATTTDEVVATSTTQSQTAAVAAAEGSSGTKNLMYYIFVALLLLVAGGLYLRKRKKTSL